MKNNYPYSKFSYGFELEMADVPKLLIDLPERLGKWEHAEKDIVNTLPPYRGIAVDPLGINPPVGGEVNIYPSRSVEDEVDKILGTIKLIRSMGYKPNVCPTSHNHHHIHVDGLRDDIQALKRLAKYVVINQDDFIDATYGFIDHPEFKGLGKAKTYMKLDGARTIPMWMVANIVNKAKDFNEFINLHAMGKDGVSRGRPFRYAINMYCLKHTDTIEFRCFRGSFERDEIEDSFTFCKLFVYNALNNGPSVKQVLKDNYFNFPKMMFDRELLEGWEKTKKKDDVGEKNRKYYKV